MTKEEYYNTLPKDTLITYLKNTEYQLERAKDKVQYLTGCRGFGEPDGTNGSCVECSYNSHELFEKCCAFDSIFLPWHLKKYEERRKHEDSIKYATLSDRSF